MNLAHIKCLSMLLGALCAVQTVCLSKLAGAFDSKASRESSFRRIQRFMAQMILDILADPDGYARVSAAARRDLYLNWDDVVREVYGDYCAFVEKKG